MLMPNLQTMKEVAEHVQPPAHWVIHLCETGMVGPNVAAEGRGSVRRFSREELFPIALALDFQDAGAETPFFGKLPDQLDRLMAMREVQRMP